MIGCRLSQEEAKRLLAKFMIIRLADVRLEGFANQFVVHPHQKLVSCWIEPRHGRTKRACDPVYGAMD
jgi:hypothetical protein